MLWWHPWWVQKTSTGKWVRERARESERNNGAWVREKGSRRRGRKKRRRACEIFIVVSSELCCLEEAFNWDSYNVVNYKLINYITIMIQNLYLARYISKPLCSVVPNAKNKSMQQKDNSSIKYSVIWKAHSQTFVEEQYSAESLNLSSCRKFCCSFTTQSGRKTSFS